MSHRYVPLVWLAYMCLGHSLTTSVDDYQWKLNPIEVRGQHMYDSVTGAQFRGAGIGFPNLGDVDISEWVATLQRIKNESSHMNLVRVYTAPKCSQDSDCMLSFMQAADTLGVYVLVAGSGTVWGWIPIDPTACGSPPTANGCYKNGGALGFGQKVVQRFNYPNTLAIMVANEIDRSTMYPYAAVLKGFARDLKSYMKMCNTDAASPTKGKMRQIPLLYAKSDDGGDVKDEAYADYLFCGNSSISVDIFGLNVERWCDTVNGKVQYQDINKWVSDAKFPGAFMFTEMGCSNVPYHGARDWAQVPGLFSNFPAVSAFSAYTYHDVQKQFNMFDSGSATAQITKDGQNFFNQVNNIGSGPTDPVLPPTVKECTASMLGVPMDSVESVLWYDTGPTGAPAQCPKPYTMSKAATDSAGFVV